MAPPALAVSANLRISPRTVAGLRCRPLQAKDSGLCKNSIALSKFHRMGRALLARPCRSCKPKNIPPHPWRACNAGPYKQKIQAYAKILSLFQNFIVWGEHCSPALAAAANQKIFPRTAGGPAMQAPTSERQGLRKNTFALSKFHRRGEHCLPALAAAASPKIYPRTVGGPAMQAPTS